MLSDEEVQLLVTAKHIPSYKLESILGDHVRGVDIRRQMLSKLLSIPTSLDRVPYMNYDYKYVSIYLVCKHWKQYCSVINNIYLNLNRNGTFLRMLF